MAEKIKTVVRIGGNEYTIVSALPEEYVHKVAIYVDRKMNDVNRQRDNLSTAMAAVMAAINIADEVMELRGEKETFLKMEREKAGRLPQQQPVRSNITSFKEAKKG